MEEKLAATVAVDERNEPLPRFAAPWLVLPFEEEDEKEEGKKPNQAFYNISEPNNKTCRRSIPELSVDNTIYQKPSHQGWLVIRNGDNKGDMYDNGVCSLWNPTSLETMQLPHLGLYLDSKFDECEHYYIIDCVLSSPPLKDASNNLVKDNDSMVYFLVLGIIDLIAYCRVGDAKWRKLEIPKGIVGERRSMSSLIWFKGKLYVMCRDDKFQVVVEKLPPLSGEYDRIRLGIRRLEVSLFLYEIPFIGRYLCLRKVFFLESCEEIYRIDMVCLGRRGYLNNLVVSINVSRLDFSEMSWKEVNSLGDTVLFLGKNTTSCCSAAELGLSKGYLYYAFPEDQSLYVFDVEDKCTTTIFPCSELPMMTRFSSQWIMMPPPSFSVHVGRRMMENMTSKVRQDDYTIKAKETEETVSKYDNENPRKKQDKKDLGEARPWVLGNEALVDSISSYLHPVDILHLRAVCKANYKVPIVSLKQIFGAMRSTYATPWLLYSTENDTRHNFVDPMHNNEKYLMKQLPESVPGPIIRCQKGGWLLMSKGRFTLFFYNPFTKETIQLPKFHIGYCFAGISFTSLPTCSNCVVFGITQQNEEAISIYTTKRGYNHWACGSFQNNDLEKYMPTFNEPVYHKGAFYCVGFNGTLGVFRGRRDWKVLETPRGYSNAAYVSFLVNCEDKLLLVQILGMSVTILRLDKQNMVWLKVNSLGKHMLFINFTSCLAAVAPESWMENKVYFPRLHDERILYYSLVTGSYHAVGSTHSAKNYYDTKSWTNCTWIEPNWSRSTLEQLDWLNKNPT